MGFDKYRRRGRIRRRIRKVISGTAEKPRMSVFRSNKQIFVQLIDDRKGITLLASSSLDKEICKNKIKKTEKAALVGASIAEKALKTGINEVAFDRGGYLYHGRVKALAEAARKKGLKF